MAVTSIWPIKGRVEDVIKYAKNPEKTTEENTEVLAALHAVDDVVEYAADEMKTEKMMFVSGVNCDSENAVEVFKNTIRDNLRSTRADAKRRVCFHGYQSFAEGEVDADTAHNIGVELAKRLWGEKFPVLVATHCNTNHYHNHFVICAVSDQDGSKFLNKKEDYRRMREESDRLCKEYGLSVIEHPKDKGMNYSEWRAEQEGVPTLRSSIRAAIDLAIKGSTSKKQFLDAMDEMGFIIDESGKYAKIKHIGTERFVRFKSLGEGYSVEEIIKRIYSNKEHAYIELPPQDDPQNVFEGEDEPAGQPDGRGAFEKAGLSLPQERGDGALLQSGGQAEA